MLKQDLKSKSGRLKYEKRLASRKSLNKKFATNPKHVYRSRKGSNIIANKIPEKTDVEEFWKNIWNVETKFKQNVKWLPDLDESYCTNITPKVYSININILNKAINKTKINKSPGRDKITGFWYKKLTFYQPDLANLFQQTLQGDTKLPKWLSLALTSLLPKNNETHIPKNYRPIACLNIMYKLFTSCLNLFLTDHVQSNNIITPEQAGGKRGVWGTTEQLLVNKNMKRVKSLRGSLTTVWLDYKKAFDSVPHSWLIHALELAKVPLDIINAISNLTNCWYTILNLQGKNESLMSEVIRFLKGIFQGDSLSILLFVLALNPLSFMLKRLSFGKTKNCETHP